MPKLEHTKENVDAVADRLLIEHGSVPLVRLSDVLKSVAGRKLGVGRTLAGWRREQEQLAVSMPEAARRLAMKFAEDLWLLTQALHRQAEPSPPQPPAERPTKTHAARELPERPPAIHASIRTRTPVAPSPPPVRTRPQSSPADDAVEVPDFTDIGDPGAGDRGPARKRRPESAGEWTRPRPAGPETAKRAKNRRKRMIRVPANPEQRRVDLAERLKRLDPEFDIRPNRAAPRPVRKTDWRGANSEIVAEAAARELSKEGFPLEAKVIADRIAETTGWTSSRAYRHLPRALEGSRIVKVGNGRFWFADEKPPQRPRRPSYQGLDTADALQRKLGDRLFAKVIELLRTHGSAMTPEGIEQRLGEGLEGFSPNWLRQRLKREVKHPETHIAKTPSGYVWRKRTKANA